MPGHRRLVLFTADEVLAEGVIWSDGTVTVHEVDQQPARTRQYVSVEDLVDDQPDGHGLVFLDHPD